MPTCLGHVEETLVLVSGPGPGSSLPPRNASDRCIPDRLGAVMSCHPARGLWKAFLYPRAGYVPKVPSSVPRPVVLQAFCPPPFRESNQGKLNCMCPVRALDAYVHRTALWRKTDQLLVCYGPPKKGLPAASRPLAGG